MPNGDYMWTIGRRKFWPLDPQIEGLNLDDITHSLSQIVRFTGHLTEQFSVAQHSVILSALVPPEFARWALLHDASECYLNDLNKPAKRGIQAYCSAENRIMRLVARRYGLSWPEPRAVKLYDYALALYEAAYFGQPPLCPIEDWILPNETIPTLDGLVIKALPWRDARELFREVIKRNDISEPTSEDKDGQES